MRYGSLFDATQTMVAQIADDLYEVQVVSWYDNENSYTSQMVRTIKYFAELANLRLTTELRQTHGGPVVRTGPLIVSRWQQTPAAGCGYRKEICTMLNKKTVDDLKDLKGKKVLVRCDFNVPLKEGVIQNYNRIDGAIPTIKKLLDQGAKVILCSHLGKPKGQPLPEMSLAPVAPALSERLGVEVKFADDPQVTGPETQKMAAELKDGEVLLLQNTRYRVEETKFKDGDAALRDTPRSWPPLRRRHFCKRRIRNGSQSPLLQRRRDQFTKENVVGYLMEKEIKFLGQAVENPVRPFVAILGGAKVSDKINVINNLLDKVTP